ncbi:MAG: hypothetical protein AAF916_12965, partial [Planctomycetota bacterium]
RWHGPAGSWDSGRRIANLAGRGRGQKQGKKVGAVRVHTKNIESDSHGVNDLSLGAWSFWLTVVVNLCGLSGRSALIIRTR